MKMILDCIPCFIRQILASARLTGADEHLQKKVLNESVALIPHFDHALSPPELARKMYTILAQHTRNKDPFKDLKEKSNRLVLEIYPHLKKTVRESPDPLLTAMKIAIAGNIIDYGAQHALKIEEEIENIISNKFGNIHNDHFDYDHFQTDLRKANTILYLGDNAGEIVCDKILIEELVASKKITYAVKEAPIINDALMEDAHMCGLDKIVPIISNGFNAPGTVLQKCSPEFLKHFHSADLIISKGQGNFETLSDVDAPIYFLFKIKCPAVAKYVNAPTGTMILKKQNIKTAYS